MMEQMKIELYEHEAGPSQRMYKGNPIESDDLVVEVYRGEEKLGTIRLIGITDSTVLIELHSNGERKAVTWEAKGL